MAVSISLLTGPFILREVLTISIVTAGCIDARDSIDLINHLREDCGERNKSAEETIAGKVGQPHCRQKKIFTTFRLSHSHHDLAPRAVAGPGNGTIQSLPTCIHVHVLFTKRLPCYTSSKGLPPTLRL
jgi:hypothetical protein